MNDNSKKSTKKNIYGVLEQLNNILSSRENFKTLEQKLTEFSLLATAHLGDMNASNKPLNAVTFD